LREADIGCARYDACYDPPPLEWGWPEWALVLAIVLLVVWLLWLMTKEPAKPEKPLEERVKDLMTSAEDEASNWADPEAAKLVRRTWNKIAAEFAKG
jgi:hypothetical protein